MAVGFGLLRLSPAAFWAMTPREFERAWSVFRPSQAGAPTRHELEALMNLFPDDMKSASPRLRGEGKGEMQ